MLAKSREWQREHRDQRKEYMREYYLSHREEWARDSHLRYDKNREARSAAQAEYYKKNGEAIRQRVAKYRKNNPDKILVTGQNQRAKRSKAAGSFTVAEWRAIVAKQRSKCNLCGVKTRLTKDHIIPLSKGGSNFAFNIQGLCKSCNSSKNAKLPPLAQHSLFDNYQGGSMVVTASTPQ
jgi:5-methylcytosine-specific restriction endonuclease McrA